MTSLITLKGIEQAISNLNYGERKTLQQRLVATIRKFYRSESSVDALQGIDTAELVKTLWMTGEDPMAVKSRRRNLSSIKYSVNARLKRLFREGKNPEGVVIGRTNIFVMSDEAKDRYLEAFKDFMRKQGFGALSNIAEIMHLLNEVLTSLDSVADTRGTERSGKIQQLKNLMEGFSKTEDLGEPDLTDFGAEAFMTLSMGNEPIDSADISGMSDDLGEIAHADTDRDEETGRLEDLNHEEDIVHAIESLDEGQLKGVIDDPKAGVELQEAEAEEDLGEVFFDHGETEGLEVGGTSKKAEKTDLIKEAKPEREIRLDASEEAERPSKTRVNKK
ncbi:MAG TPA: hypothetical protein VMW89_20185 [Desulfatiglandales bacterium]|nr:hypothetical protein [Desulfatiglandales bacterium]